MSLKSRSIALAAVAALSAVALAGCASSSPLDSSSTSTAKAGGPIVVGSANFPESEIIAQIYTQALKDNGVDSSIKPNIGAREVYLKALQDGSIDLIPEYSGSLLQYYDPSSTAQSSDDVYAALSDALPKGYQVLDQAKAQDADSYNVTKAFSQKWGVTSLADLTKVTVPLTVGANPEFADRPYGIKGLKSAYGVTATLDPISDGGGPLTVKALQDGTVQLADIYTTSSAIKDNDFVTLKDPKNIIIAENVVPIINSSKVDDKVSNILNKVSATLTTDDLVTMNDKSSGSAKESAEQIAKEWLAEKNLFTK
ncbi:ABC transporter substrate-binding protein [Planctomonas sp. JC2975]|uniref:ABC transporter substrate-binding protein n=1 Tax=Planctomonas sp. JC2975 TaxID=2729626 RepID=UPI0014750747|nr:ABC transporter substrate-binding protein [Planctomonas sp. JC2975]NNC10794.1 ABC transporter substrate-binding protein [Planctomonas sp. JC2975]